MWNHKFVQYSHYEFKIFLGHIYSANCGPTIPTEGQVPYCNYIGHGIAHNHPQTPAKTRSSCLHFLTTRSATDRQTDRQTPWAITYRSYTAWFKMDSISYVYISWNINDMWMIYITLEKEGPKSSNIIARELELSPSAQTCSSVSWEQNGYYAAQDLLRSWVL